MVKPSYREVIYEVSEGKHMLHTSSLSRVFTSEVESDESICHVKLVFSSLDSCQIWREKSTTTKKQEGKGKNN